MNHEPDYFDTEICVARRKDPCYILSATAKKCRPNLEQLRPTLGTVRIVVSKVLVCKGNDLLVVLTLSLPSWYEHGRTCREEGSSPVLGAMARGVRTYRSFEEQSVHF